MTQLCCEQALRPLISQLALANESEGGGTVVVLSDKMPMDELMRIVELPDERDLRGTETVVRHGSPL